LIIKIIIFLKKRKRKILKKKKRRKEIGGGLGQKWGGQTTPNVTPQSYIRKMRNLLYVSDL
jgi:hypothetical protein